MSELPIFVPDFVDESSQRKRNLEFPRSSAYKGAAPIQSFPKANYDPWDDEDINPLIEKEYDRQDLESDGFDVDHFHLPYGGKVPHILVHKYDYPYDLGLFGRVGLHCYNLDKGVSITTSRWRRLTHPPTLFAIFRLVFSETTFRNMHPLWYRPKFPDLKFVVVLELLLLGLREDGRDDAVDDSYKGKMPKWLTDDEMAAISYNGQFCELQESDLQGNEWLHLYAEFAFHLNWMTKSNLRQFLPLEINKVIVKTNEIGEDSPPCMKLKANNAIFYISFKGNGDPSGTQQEYQAVVRKTMDGMPGHICLEVDCLAHKSG